MQNSLKLSLAIFTFLLVLPQRESQAQDSPVVARSIASTRNKDNLIPFPSGPIDPVSFQAPPALYKTMRQNAEKVAKEKGITKAADCFTGEVEGYYLFCYLAYAQRTLKGLPDSNPNKKLPPEEYAALAWYADFGFEIYNDALWSQDPKELKENETNIKLALSGLNRLPRETQKVVRCDLADSSETTADEEIRKMAARYSAEKPSTIKGFWSTSIGTDPAYIEQWIKPCFVLLNITLKGSGASIAAISSRHTEQEVLVRPMTKFAVTRKTESTKNGKPFFEIDLTETE